MMAVPGLAVAQQLPTDLLNVPVDGSVAAWIIRTFGLLTILSVAPGILINTSRAGVVDHDALLAHLEAGTLRAGLDVFPDEPAASSAAWDSALARHAGVVGTHHIGASTEQAQAAVLEGVLEVVAAFVRGEPRHVVNR